RFRWVRVGGSVERAQRPPCRAAAALGRLGAKSAAYCGRCTPPARPTAFECWRSPSFIPPSPVASMDRSPLPLLSRFQLSRCEARSRLLPVHLVTGRPGPVGVVEQHVDAARGV